MKKIKARLQSLYGQQLLLTAGMVLLTMLLLGMSFFAISYTYTVAEKRGEMRERAQLIADLSVRYINNDPMEDLSQDDVLRSMTSVAAMMSDANFLICNQDGYVVLTTDENLVGKVVSIPQEITGEILTEDGDYEGRSNLGELYEKKQFVVGVPMVSDDQPVGMVISVMDGTKLMGMWRSFIALFSMTAGIVLLISFLASSITSMRQIQPIQEMVQATRAYADGNFDIRMMDSGRDDEISELANSFNLMADSLAETERQRRDFIANVSHELKTPMTTIAGYTDGILDGTIPAEREKQYLQIISDESHRLSRLVRRMLDISRLQSQEMKKERFDLCESMRISLLSMEQKIIDRELDVTADIPDAPVFVEGDNELITQVIYNLLENATKFAIPDSTLYLGLVTNSDKAIVTVRNTGSTIPAEEIPLLFERFHKSDKSRSVDKDGYGLGLYVVKTILDQHKEKISVSSVDGVTEFSFTVQLAGGWQQ